MLKIIIPSLFIPEKKYVFDILLGEFLGLDFEIEESDKVVGYEIWLGTKKIKIEDAFFGKCKNEQYLSIENIPNEISYFTNSVFDVKDIPVIYGELEIINSEDGINCRVDLIASSFFMLSRWEEFVIKNRDKHDRFSAFHSLAYKFNFLHRAVVNEYVELLWKMLLHIDSKLKRKAHTFEIVPTHDVDHIKLWKSISSSRKRLAHNFITQRKFKNGLLNAKSMLFTLLGLEKDPFDSFDYIMDMSEKEGMKSRFYFLCGGNTKYDNNLNINSTAYKNVINNIKNRDHIIGFHPSYNTSNRPEIWQEEKLALEKASGQSIHQGRHHYLRFIVPETWQLWEDENMEIDSTAGYHDMPGFRCGTCYPYSVFNFRSRKKLIIKEMPLIFMEMTAIEYMKKNPHQTLSIVKSLFNEVEKYNGKFVFLWHNSSMFTAEFKPYLFIYESIIKRFK